MVNASLSDLRTGNFSINAHQSQQDINTYVACGNIPAAGTAAAATAAAAPSSLPLAGGAGLLVQDQGGIGWQPLAALAAGIAMLFASGTWVLVRIRRSR